MDRAGGRVGGGGRCLRVFRLFKRIPSLRQIVVSLVASFPPMTNAMLIVFLFVCVYSIMAANFFSDARPDLFGDFFGRRLPPDQCTSNPASGFSGVSAAAYASAGAVAAGTLRPACPRPAPRPPRVAAFR